MGKFKYLIALLFVFSVSQAAFSQVELVPLSNPVYDFLDRMFTE